MTSRGRQEDRKGRTSARASSLDSQARAPGLALPADFGRSLRLLDDDALDKLVKAAMEKTRRRGRDVPQGTSEEHRQSEPTEPVKGRAKKAGTSVRPGAVTHRGRNG